MTRVTAIAAVFLLFCTILCAPAEAREATLTRAEIQDGWILLFDGESMFGLTQEGPLIWKASDGSLVADGSTSGYVRTNSAFSDFDLKMDVLFARASCSGSVFVRTGKAGTPSDNGYRIPLTDEESSWPAGSVVNRFAASTVRPAAGQWHSLEIQVQGTHLAVLIDQKSVTDGDDPAARAGYIGLKVESGCRFEFRNIKLKPLTDVALFDGSDLAGWKIAKLIPTNKPSKLKKIIPFAGGKPKVKESDWSVRAGTIHGEKGPGQLETTALYDDFLLQFDLAIAPQKQPAHPSVYIRGDAGNLFTGYEILMDPANPGAIAPGLASPRKIISLKESAVATVAAKGRHFQVWVNGFPVTEFIDTRAESTVTADGAKTNAGTVVLPLHDSTVTADYTKIQLATVAKSLGGVISKAAAPAQSPATAGGGVAGTGPTQSPAGMPDPGLPFAKAAAQQEAKQRRAAQLMNQALNTSDPATQMRIFQQVIQIDPNNQAAFQGYNEAKAKVEAQQREQEKQRDAASAAEQNDARTEDAVNRAQQAFLAGDLTRASSALAVAEQIAPANSAVMDLRRKINDAQALRDRWRYLLSGGALVGLGGVSTFWFLRRRRREGFLQVVSGLDNGRRYDLSQQVVKIGAIAQDGAGKNDIVIRDVEHMISRFHCEIHRHNGKFYVVDCGSANGTRLDNRKVRPNMPQRIKNGAKLELAGTVALRFGMEKRKTAS